MRNDDKRFKVLIIGFCILSGVFLLVMAISGQYTDQFPTDAPSYMLVPH